MARRRYAMSQQEMATATATSASSVVITREMIRPSLGRQTLSISSISGPASAVGATWFSFFSKVRMAFDCTMISSRSCPSWKEVPTCRSVPGACRRLLRPKASTPSQCTGGHDPKQTRMLHWNRRLLLLGNLKALKRAINTLFSGSYSQLSNIDRSVAQPLASVTSYCVSSSLSMVLAMQPRAKPP